MITCTISKKDGRKYYFRNGKRIKNPGIEITTSQPTTPNKEVKLNTQITNSNECVIPKPSGFDLTKNPEIKKIETVSFLVIERRCYSSVGSCNIIRTYSVNKDNAIDEQKKIIEKEEAQFMENCRKYGDDTCVSYKNKGKSDYTRLCRYVRIIAKSSTRNIGIIYLGNETKSLKLNELGWV